MCLEHQSIKSKKTVSSWQRKEAEGTPQKKLLAPTTLNDMAILANAPTQAKTLLHSLEQAATGIGLHFKFT